MSAAPPELIAIDHDDFHASSIGRTADGRQFFLTTPFEPASANSAGNEFIALYLFDERGGLIEAIIDSLGPRAAVDNEQARRLFNERLQGLGDIKYGRIEIAPFSLERFGTTFGLVPRPPEDDDDVCVVEAQPGNFMAFFEPWDSGEYDT